MHCPHKSPHFLSIQETVSHSLAPDILQVSVCLWDCSANHNMFINENKRKNATLSGTSFVVWERALRLNHAAWWMLCEAIEADETKMNNHGCGCKLAKFKTNIFPLKSLFYKFLICSFLHSYFKRTLSLTTPDESFHVAKYLILKLSRGANPTKGMNSADACQLHFLFRWNIPPPFNQLTPPPPLQLLFMNWTQSPRLWQHLTSHLRPSRTTLCAIKVPLSCYYPPWWLT